MVHLQNHNTHNTIDMKALTTLAAAAGLLFGVMAAGCTSEEIVSPGTPNGDGTIEESEKPNHDERFPFAVWTDEAGIVHFDVKLDENGSYPAKDVVLRNLAGNGWELDKCYTYQYSGPVDNKYEYRLLEDDFIFGVVGGDASPKFFFTDEENAIHYYRWDGACTGQPELGEHFATDNVPYSYDAKSGVLDCNILGWYKVIVSTPTELWLGTGNDPSKEPYYYQFVRYVKASPETVAAWNEKYTD